MEEGEDDEVDVLPVEQDREPPNTLLDFNWLRSEHDMLPEVRIEA